MAGYRYPNILCFVLCTPMDTWKCQGCVRNIRWFWPVYTDCEINIDLRKQYYKPAFLSKLIQYQTAQLQLLFNHLFKRLFNKPYTLCRLRSSNPLQNITNAVQLEQNILHLCKLESKTDVLFINYSHAAAKGFFNS